MVVFPVNVVPFVTVRFEKPLSRRIDQCAAPPMPVPCRFKRGKGFILAIGIKGAAGHGDRRGVINLIPARAAELRGSAADNHSKQRRVNTDRMHVIGA